MSSKRKARPKKEHPGHAAAAQRGAKKAPPIAKPPVKPPIATIPAGLLGDTFLRRLKTAPHGTADSVLVTETLRSLPPEQLKAALAKAGAKERGLLFSVMPGDQIKSVLASLPASLLAPSVPVPPQPFPAPTGGPPASILQTTYVNVPYPPAASDPNWSEKISNGSTLGITSPPPWEWVSVYNPSFEKEGSLENPVVGVTG